MQFGAAVLTQLWRSRFRLTRSGLKRVAALSAVDGTFGRECRFVDDDCFDGLETEVNAADLLDGIGELRQYDGASRACEGEVGREGSAFGWEADRLHGGFDLMLACGELLIDVVDARPEDSDATCAIVEDAEIADFEVERWCCGGHVVEFFGDFGESARVDFAEEFQRQVHGRGIDALQLRGARAQGILRAGEGFSNRCIEIDGDEGPHGG